MLMRPWIVVLTLVCTCCVISIKFLSINLEDDECEFVRYIEQFNKSYRFNVDEYQKRFERFQKSLQMINAMNKLRTTEHCARFGFTEYTDLSDDEFVTMKLNLIFQNTISNHRSNSIGNATDKRNIIRYERDVPGKTLPEKIDWRDRGVVSKIRSQGSCGACWAYSVIGTVESMTMIAIQENVSTSYELSIQQMIDCAGNSNHGCRGGDTCKLLSWLVKEDVNIYRMEEYPISNTVDNQCKMDDMQNTSWKVHVKGFTCNSFVGQEEKILQILANYGPVVAAVNGLLWQNYLGGIIQYHCDGSISNVNHAVQIVGYDRTGDIPYYIVRNSWGLKFGDIGYLKIKIGSNVCGVANQVSKLRVEVLPSK